MESSTSTSAATVSSTVSSTVGSTVGSMVGATSASNAVAAPIATTAAAAASDGFDWSGRGQGFLKSVEHSPSAEGFEGLLKTPYFAHVALGSFELYIPVKQLHDPKQAELFQEFSQIAVDLQAHWHAWRGSDLGSETPQKDWQALRKWVDGWKPKKMSSIKGGPVAINEQIKGYDKLQELQERLAEKGQTNPKMQEYLGLRNRIVFAPRRQDFVELLAAAGVLVESQQKYVWDQANLTRTAAWVDWVEVLCFEESAYPFEIKQPYLGQTMNRIEPTARTQFIADRLTLQLMRKEFYPNGTHFFELSLGTNLVISTLGFNNAQAGDWNVSFKTEGGRTEAYERFIPGGNAGGGVLPARRASAGPTTGTQTQVSRYRKEKGANYFQASLKLSQKDAAKLAKSDKEAKNNPLAKNKLAHFVLHSFENGEDTYISAPFLGALGESKKLPANEFIDDYEDFFRAYRSGFFHWLVTHYEKDPALSMELYSKLIKTQAAREEAVSFESVIEQVYDLPISAADDTTDSLEWRYLAWIQKSK